MIEWHRVADILPNEDNLECLLLGESGKVFGPISWHEQSQVWLDLFASPEAGTLIAPDQEGLTHWAEYNGPKNDGSGD